MNTKPIGPFLGINNRLPDYALVTDPRTGECFVRSADNVDVSSAGKFRRRPATAVVQAMTDAHSLHMLTDTTGVLVRGAALYAITLPTYTESLLKVLSSDAPMSYAALGTCLYMSNGTDRYRLEAGVVSPMALPTPGEPPISLISGALLPGWYQVSTSYRVSGTPTVGEEGGTSPSNNIHITSGTAGIRVTLPGPVAGATHVAVHLSHANGKQPYLATTVTSNTVSVDLTALATGHEAPLRFEDILPAGELFVSNGRLCSITNGGDIDEDGSTAGDAGQYRVNIGLPFRPGYYLVAEGYIPFPAPVTLAIENQGGTFIAADKTYWVPGDLGDVKDKLATVLPYGAVQGTAFEFPDRSMVGWFGAKGFVFGKTSGEVEAVMTENVDQTPPASGRSIVLEEEGYRRAVSCGWCVNLESKNVTTYSGWDFTSLSGGYGTKADGIYQLVAPGVVDADIGLGKQNFGVEVVKYLPAIYLGTDSDMPMQARVLVPGGGDYTYDARRGDSAMQMQRVDTGRGLKAVWFDIHVMNQFGADFNLSTVSPAPTATTRRI